MSSSNKPKIELLTPAEKEKLRELLRARSEALKSNKLAGFYPDDGLLRRELYPRHIEFFSAGASHRERAFIAANRIGKTEGVGCFETTLHLTGRYPEWWNGRRFERAISAWAAGDSAKTTRDILQTKMLGRPGDFGTGMLPKDSLLRWTPKAGVPEAIETVYVKHVNGGVSELAFRSFDQGIEAFQGTERHLVWLDEECPQSVYTECLMRTMTTDGLILMTFTPLWGMTDLVRDFLLNPGRRFAITATWEDCPHLSAEAKADLLASIPEYQKNARTKGVPQLGSGAIYQIPEGDVVVADFEIPKHFHRVYGLDPGWNRTAIVWGARDPDGVIYLYNEYYASQTDPFTIAHAVQQRGKWIPGVIDPAVPQLSEAYKHLGLDLEAADNSVELGIFAVWELLKSGRLKVFKSLGNWLNEFRLYQRDAEGKVVKEHDHLMDATRYLVMTGRQRMAMEAPPPAMRYDYRTGDQDQFKWMQ